MVCEKLPQLCACGVLSKSESDTALGAFTQYLFKRFDKNPQDWFTLVNQLKSNQHSWDLLQRHWHLGLDNSRKKIDYYQDYADAVMANETDYQKAYLNPFANSCWNKLNDKQRFEMAIHWLRSGHLEDLERRYKEGNVEEKDYVVMKRNAKKRIAEIKAKKWRKYHLRNVRTLLKNTY